MASNERGRTRVYLPYLRAWRVAKLMTQDELAQLTGVATSTIIKLERQDNAANLSTVAKLASGLDITRHQLVYEPPSEHKRGDEGTAGPPEKHVAA